MPCSDSGRDTLFVQRAHARDFSTEPRREIAFAPAFGDLRFVIQLDFGHQQPRVPARRGMVVGGIVAGSRRVGLGLVSERAALMAVSASRRCDAKRVRISSGSGFKVRRVQVPFSPASAYKTATTWPPIAIGTATQPRPGGSCAKTGAASRSSGPGDATARALGRLRDDARVVARDVEGVAALKRGIEAQKAPAVKTIAAHEQNTGPWRLLLRRN